MNLALPGKACNLPANKAADDYYPKVDQGGGRFATRCDGHRLQHRAPVRRRPATELHGHRARPLYLVLSLDGDELRGHLAPTAVVLGCQQRPDRRPERRLDHGDGRWLHLLRRHPRPLGAGPEERVRRQHADWQSLCFQRRPLQSPEGSSATRLPRLRESLPLGCRGRQLSYQQLRGEPAAIQHLRRPRLPGLQRVPGYQPGGHQRLPSEPEPTDLSEQSVAGRAGAGPAPGRRRRLLHAQCRHRVEAAQRLLLPAGFPLDEPLLQQRGDPPLRDRAAVPARHLHHGPGRGPETLLQLEHHNVHRVHRYRPADRAQRRRRLPDGASEHDLRQRRPVLQRAGGGQRVRLRRHGQDQPLRLRDDGRLSRVRDHRLL